MPRRVERKLLASEGLARGGNKTTWRRRWDRLRKNSGKQIPFDFAKKSPPFRKERERMGHRAPALKRIRNDKYLSERSDGGDSSSTHASSPSRTSRRAACLGRHPF